MAIVIRPSEDVFRARTPILVVFGAYREADEPGLAEPERIALSEVCAEARRFHVNLAFCRAADASGQHRTGAWQEGCRPTTRDMVVDARGRSCFENEEFAVALELRNRPRLALCGPAGDSLFLGSVADAVESGLRIQVIDLAEVLHQCSTPEGNDTRATALADASKLGYIISRERWLAQLRSRDTGGTSANE